MKIGPQEIPSPLDTLSRATAGARNEARPAGRATGAGEPTVESAAAGGTRVQLSSVAMASRTTTDGDVDMQKVEKIRQAIADGSYQVNAEAIADQLINNAAEFLKPKA